MSFTVVDLPEPFGPSSPKTSPCRTSKSTLSTARALGRPQKSLKILVRPRTATMVSLVLDIWFSQRRADMDGYGRKEQFASCQSRGQLRRRFTADTAVGRLRFD